MKNKNAIMIADTRPALIGNLLVQLKHTNPDVFDEALIYYDEITETDKQIMESIMPCKFVKFDYQFPDKLKKLPAFEKFSPLMFARYYMFDLLDEYQTVTWLDTDVLVCGDLHSIIDKALKNGMSANFEDKYNKSYLCTDTVRTSFTQQVGNYDFTRYNMSSGLITVANTLKNYNLMTKWCFDKTIEYAEYLVLPDQGILNILIQEFNIDVAGVGERGGYCFYPSYKKDATNAKIIHAWGARKFWRSWYLYKTFPKWKEYYQEWLDMGGSDFCGEINPEVSIVIPTYKTNTQYFDLILNDLLVKQVQASDFQYDNFEIIIVADGEIEKSFYDLLNKYDDERIVLIHNKEKVGIAKSINMGIKAAKGKYIARIDDDDRVEKTRLFKQVSYLEEHQNVHLVSSYFKYFGDMNEGRITFEGDLCKAWSIFTCPFDHPTIMFRRDFFVENELFYDEKRSHVEDWELWLRAFDKKMKVGVIPEVLYYHRWYNGQAGQNTKTVDMMRELVRLNFEKLNVELSEEELVYVSPWQGRVDEKKYKRLEEIFHEALKNNTKLKLYNQEALKKVFDYRLEEAKTGTLSSLILTDEQCKQLNDESINSSISIGRRIKRRVLKPIYKPFKRVYYNIVSEAVNDNIGRFNEKIEDSLYQPKEEINNLKLISNKIINNVDANAKTQMGSLNLLLDKQYDLQMQNNLMADYINDNLFFDKKVILIGTSGHGNIGDAAITLGVYEFIRKHFPNHRFMEITTYDFEDKFSYIQRIVNNDDLILLQGGGNLGNKYIVEENLRRKVIATFPNNRIVILPQTIYFDDENELNISKEIYNRHKDLIIFTRGKTSYKLAKELFSNAKCYLSVDSALNLNYSFNYERKGILSCIRDLDDESGLNRESYNQIFQTIKSYDKNSKNTVNTIDGNITKNMRNRIVYEQLQEFSKHQVIVTDRLHGLIFALMTNTPCIVISSYNHKLNEFVDMLKGNKGVYFIDKDIDKLSSYLEKVLKQDLSNYQNNFADDFAQNAKIIKEDNDQKK